MQVTPVGPKAIWVGMALIAMVVLVTSAVGCAPVFGSWSGDWRSADGALMILTPEQSVATVAFNSDDTATGHFVPAGNGGATIDWLTYPSPATAALAPRATLTRVWNRLALTSRSEAATYAVAVFPPGDATDASIGDLQYRLRSDPAVVDVTYIPLETLLSRFVDGMRDWPQMLLGVPPEDSARPVVLVSVKSSQDPGAFVRKVQAMPSLISHAKSVDPLDRSLVIAGPRGERTIWFTRAK